MKLKLSKKNIMIAGSLPAQNDTYVKDERDTKIIESGFLDQALCLQQYVDFYYLDVMSSLRECQIALSVTEKMKIPSLVGLHIKADGKLPSGEKIYDVINECKKYNIELWNCIEKHNNTVKYCGKPFYAFYRCFNSIKY